MVSQSEENDNPERSIEWDREEVKAFAETLSLE
jgi:hypothetical protein